jgi:hypothetical protein
MLFKFQKIVGCIEPWVKNRDTNRIVSLCIVTALDVRVKAYSLYQDVFLSCQCPRARFTRRKKQGGPEVCLSDSLVTNTQGPYYSHADLRSGELPLRPPPFPAGLKEGWPNSITLIARGQ